MHECNLTESDLRELVGTHAPTAYEKLLLSHTNLREFSIFRYLSPPLLQDRVTISDFEEDIIDDAIRIRSESNIPFWEAIFSACLTAGQCTQPLLEATFFHMGQGQPTSFGRDDIISGILSSVTENNARNVGLSSAVRDKKGDLFHFSFMDFHCDVREANTQIVVDVCKRIMPSGFLVLDSGDSYHAVSVGLDSVEQRIKSLGKALLASPIVDLFYVAHQLQQSSSSIRISRGGKANKVPTVVEAWHADRILREPLVC